MALLRAQCVESILFQYFYYQILVTFTFVLLSIYFYINFPLYINNIVFFFFILLFYYISSFYMYTCVLSRYFYFLNKIRTSLKRQKLLNVFWTKYRYIKKK